MSDQIGPDGLTDRQRAALGATRNSLGVSNAPPPPQPQPAPVQVQQPQPAPERERGILGILKGRAAQIDKAAGYACGGKIKAHAQGGKIQGPGTPTSDSIAGKVRESGEPILVSNGERIVSAEQDKLLGRIAQMLGFESVDALLESGTGKPVGPTIKGGKLAAATGFSTNNNVEDEYTRALQAMRNNSSIPSMSTNNSAAQGGIYKDVGLPSISMGAGQAPTIYDNGGLDAGTVQRGIDTMRSQMANGQPKLSSPVVESGKQAISSQLPEQAPSGPSMFDKDPLSAMSSAISRSMASSDAANAKIQSLYPAGTFDDLNSAKPTATNPQASPSAGAKSFSVPSITDISAKSPDAQFMTGAKPGDMPTSAQGGFTQGNKTYNVNDTSQQGITRVTAPGTSPLYTNINPEQAVSGLKNQTIGGDAASVQEGLDRYARANATRGQMIDSMISANGGNGVAIMPEAPQQSQGMSIADIQSAMKSAGTKTERAALGQAMNTMLNNQVQSRGQDLTHKATMYGHDTTAQRAAGHDQVLMRGQDKGYELDAPVKRAQAEGLTQANRTSSILSGLQEKAIAGDAQALATLRAMTGKNSENQRDNFMTVGGGQEWDERAGTMRNVPQRLVDLRTLHDVGGKQQAQSQAPADAVAMLKSDPKKYGAAFKEKYGYLPEGM